MPYQGITKPISTDSSKSILETWTRLNFSKPCSAFFETIDQGRRTLREKDKERKKEASKKSRKTETDSEETGTKAKRPVYTGIRQNKGKVKKFCQNCKDSNGKYWTHDTSECFVKDKAERAQKEANAMDAMKRQISEMSDLVKGLKKKLESDSDTDWLQPRKELVAAKNVGTSRIKMKTKSKLNTKSILIKTINKLDILGSKALGFEWALRFSHCSSKSNAVCIVFFSTKAKSSRLSEEFISSSRKDVHCVSSIDIATSVMPLWYFAPSENLTKFYVWNM